MKKHLLLPAALLSACATIPANAPLYSRAPEPPAGQANVYIYRYQAIPLARTPTIRIDGKPIFDPPEEAYTVVALSAGTHEFEVDWSFDAGAPDLKFPVEVAAGTPLYVKITGSFSVHANTMQFGSAAGRVEQAAAEAELKALGIRYIAPLPDRPARKN